MSEQTYEDIDEVLPEEPNGELVHWMQPRPMTFGPTALALAAAGGFAVGLAAALAVVGMSRLAGPERGFRLPPLRLRRRG